jgi:hypothetical protein
LRTVIMVPLPWFGTSLRRRRWDKYGIIGLTMWKKLLAGIFGIVGLVVWKWFLGGNMVEGSVG